MNLKTYKFVKMFVSFKEYETEQGKLIIDELAEGAEAMIMDENGELIPAADGEYVTEDGKITIADGKIASIEVETEPEPVEEESDERTDTLFKDGEFSKFAKMSHDKIKAQFEATYQEIQSNIYRALEAKGIDCYIIENTNDYVVVNQWDINWDSTLVKYEITIDEDGNVTLGEGVEVKEVYEEVEQTFATETPAEEPIEEPKEEEPAPNPELEEANKVIEEKDAKIAELEARIAELEAELAKPVEEPLDIKQTAQDSKYEKNGALKYFAD